MERYEYNRRFLKLNLGGMFGSLEKWASISFVFMVESELSTEKEALTLHE